MIVLSSPTMSYLRFVVVACVMKTAVNAGIYLFMQWPPTILLAMQVNLSKSLGYNLVIASGTLFSGIAGGLMGERSEEQTSELKSLMRSSYAVFCLKKKKNN